MDTQVLGQGLEPVRRHLGIEGGEAHGRRWIVLAAPFAVGAILGTLLGWSADRAPAPGAAIVATRPSVVHRPHLATAPTVAPAAGFAASQAGPARNGSRGLVLMIPADRDVYSSTGIPVAGRAFARPHGARIRTVHVELYVAGRLVKSANMDVYSGRFAGVLRVVAPAGVSDAELRVTDPGNASQAAETRSILLEAPAQATPG